MSKKSYFFCGIGGSGMSALAVILAAQGYEVHGSDRSHDRGETPEKFGALEQSGIQLFPQDGSGITVQTGKLIVSAAVEDSIPDVRAAKKHGVPIQKRAELLANLFNEKRGVAVGGTSGKTTVTGMLSVMLEGAGLDPTVMNGGVIMGQEGTSGLGNARIGKSDLFVIEADESDGSIALYSPEIAIVNNITLDHKPVAELRPLFTDFLKRARSGAVINLDDPEAALLRDVHARTLTFGIENQDADLNAINLKPREDGISFELDGQAINLLVPGRHNVSNALAALSVARLLDIPMDNAIKALEAFKGVQRRLQVLGTQSGVTVIDDFAHNPDKIAASLATLQEFPGRLLVMFQPHGFGPMRMMRKEIVESFVRGLGEDDILLMPEIYYAGGTAARDISSRDLIEDVRAGGRQARFFETRADILPYLQETARPGDRIVIMGARDDTLTVFGREILEELSKAASRNALPAA